MKTDWVTKGLLVFVGSGLWAMALMHGQPAARAQTSAIPSVIKAHKFELVDAQGKARATLHIYKDSPALDLFDANERPKAALSSYGLFLYDAKGNTRSSLLYNELVIMDANENNRAVLAFTRFGLVLALMDANGNDRALLGAAKKVNKVAGATTAAPFTITFFDKKGKAIYQRP